MLHNEIRDAAGHEKNQTKRYTIEIDCLKLVVTGLSTSSEILVGTSLFKIIYFIKHTVDIT